MTMTKWETNIEPYLTEVEMWASQGRTLRDMASKLGVAYNTFNKAVKEHTRLKDAIARGKKRANKKVAKTLQQTVPRVNQKHAVETPMRRSEKVGRPDKNGVHRAQFETNKKKILATQEVCAICGKPVDKTLKYPHPLSATVDHIIPIARGGHPSSLDNLQLAHFTCNRQKSDKLVDASVVKAAETISNRVLPHTFDWNHTEAWLK